MVTQSRTRILLPKNFPNFKTLYSTRHHIKALCSGCVAAELTCYSQAVMSPEWRAAIGFEFDALISNGTWSLCPRPLHHNIFCNKWVYKIKNKQDDIIKRFKARLVAKGFDQQCGIDFIETFSPMIKPSTIHVVLALAIQFDPCI